MFQILQVEKTQAETHDTIRERYRYLCDSYDRQIELMKTHDADTPTGRAAINLNEEVASMFYQDVQDIVAKHPWVVMPENGYAPVIERRPREIEAIDDLGCRLRRDDSFGRSVWCVIAIDNPDIDMDELIDRYDAVMGA